MPSTVRLGDEYDEALIRRVRRLLRDFGAGRTAHGWGVAGSQEVGQETWRLDAAAVLLEAETYVGLTLRGDEELVARIVAALPSQPA